MPDKPCKDCEPGSKRPAPHPGPRCYTHHLAFKRAAKERAHEKRVQRVYGLASGEYQALYSFQDGLCWICRVGRGITKALAVDHDHDTGEVRGLLCSRCNYDLLGNYDQQALQRALDYLAQPPYGRMRDVGRSGRGEATHLLGDAGVPCETGPEWRDWEYGLPPS